MLVKSSLRDASVMFHPLKRSFGSSVLTILERRLLGREAASILFKATGCQYANGRGVVQPLVERMQSGDAHLPEETLL